MMRMGISFRDAMKSIPSHNPIREDQELEQEETCMPYSLLESQPMGPEEIRLLVISAS